MEESIKAITNINFISALFMTLSLIVIGFIFRKCKLVDENSKKTLSTLIMKLFIPCLAFSSLLIDFDVNTLIQSGWIILITFVTYIICLLIGRLIFIKCDKQKSIIYSLLMSLGQITLFGLPLVKAIYPSTGAIVGNVMALPFRFFVYFYSYIVIANLKIEKKTIGITMKKVFLNPIIIAMLASIIIYLTQPIMPKVMINEISYSILRIDKTLEPVYYVIKLLSNLTTPLCMLLIGITLGEISCKVALTNKLAWVLALLKSLVSPLIMILMIYIFSFIPSINLTKDIICSMILCFSAPLSAIVNTYCIIYNKEEIVASDSVFLSTILSVVSVPFLIFIVTLIF